MTLQCTCLVQEGQAPDHNQSALSAALSDFVTRSFEREININWIRVAPGCGFTAGEPSTSSIVSMTAPTPLEQPEREALLRQLCDLWMEHTGCSLNEIVAVINDPT